MRGHDWINSALPDELMLNIFRFLDSKSSRDASSLVCRRWKTLERFSRDSIRIDGDVIPDSFINLIASRFVNLTNIEIAQSDLPPHYGGVARPDALSAAGLAAIADGFRKLEKLTLINCWNATRAGLALIAPNCSSLKSLHLNFCPVGEEGLRAIGECCKQLEALKFVHCQGLTDSVLVDLAFACGRTLKSLGVAGCSKITDVSLEAVGSHCRILETLTFGSSNYIHNKGVIAVAKGCPLLKNLCLRCHKITDEALSAVGTRFVLLETLALEVYPGFSDRSLRKGCLKLKSLVLYNCYFSSDKGLEAVLVTCSELTRLEIHSCHSVSTYGLESIGRACMHLKELSLYLCEKGGNEALSQVGKGCKHLEALTLESCSDIRDDAICSIAIGCNNLKKLHIGGCGEVGNNGIIAIGDNCKHLTDLSITFCDRVGDEALVAIGKGCSLLCGLKVRYVQGIGDTGITAIARGCPQLKCLDLYYQSKVGDMTLAAIGDGCPLLQDISVSYCTGITDTGLAHLVKGCKRLESCKMFGCPGVSSAGVATVVSACMNIKRVSVEKSKVNDRTRRRMVDHLIPSLKD